MSENELSLRGIKEEILKKLRENFDRVYGRKRGNVVIINLRTLEILRICKKKDSLYKRWAQIGGSEMWRCKRILGSTLRNVPLLKTEGKDRKK